MKKLLWITGVMACFSLGARAQEPQQAQQPQQAGQSQESSPSSGAEKIEALKVAFLSQKMNLSQKQAEKFWPLYNDYQKEMQQLVDQRKQFNRANKTAGSVSDAKADQNLDQEFAFRQQALAIQEKYKNEFLKVLPPRKVANFYKSEGEFKNRLIRELSNRSYPGANKGMQQNQLFGNGNPRPQSMSRPPMMQPRHISHAPMMHPHPAAARRR